VVPSYQRPQDLAHCLGALARQSHPADEILVVIRQGDLETIKVIEERSTGLPVRVVAVDKPGQVYALNAGLARADSDVIAFTDDDAAPRPFWLELIVRSFVERPELGGIGGRDVVHGPCGVVEDPAKQVGRIRWFGRRIGNHHRGAPAQEVQFLKGANMAFRRSAIGSFSVALRGQGAQVCNDMDVSLAALAGNWALFYDPGVVVDHFPGARADLDRNESSFSGLRDEAYNETYVLLKHLPLSKKVTTFLYDLLVGSRSMPGLALLPERLARDSRRRETMIRFVAGLSGRFEAIGTFVRSR
jgi:glycosyltransferase involved in cell wall biosynthesis